MLQNYILDAHTRYESHRLIYASPEENPIELTGMLGAAMLAVLIIDTPEGDARGIALDTDEQRKQFFLRYEREVRRDDWGHLAAEIDQLRNSYIQFTTGDTTLRDLCPNVRLLDLAVDVTVAYMRQLVLETFCEHIWDKVPWRDPFSQWLLDAAYVEARRQLFLQTDWTDAPMVDQLANELSHNPSPVTPRPLFVFEGEKASDIMERYLQWLSDEYVAMKQERPGAKITSADRKYIFSQETDWDFLSEEIKSLNPAERKEWNQWQREWTTFLTERLMPQEIRFWVNDVPEEVQAHLLYHLQLAEQHPAHFKDLTAAVYAMRQLGYIRRKCSDHDIRQWLSEHLKLDYMERKNASQFQRAMKEHGRYTPEVRDEVMQLESMGYFRFQAPAEE